jgi:two-component system chemotaxis response regulator CheB
VDSLVRVLIVDDSAYVRKVIRQILERSPFVEVVGAARDGEEALELVELLKPDVVTLDLIMPRVDGMTFLREQMRRRPLPVIIVTVTSEEGDLVLQALEAGAVDMVRKPTALATEKVFEIGDELVESVKAAARVRVQALRSARPAPVLATVRPAAAKRAVDVIVIGVSTGGPQALRYLIPQLPADFAVPVAMVLHMPVGYTELYAQKLAEISQMDVAEASEGAEFRPGLALLAPAGRHMTFRRSANGTIRAHLDLQPSDTIHRPSVDVLFKSAAEVYGERVLGLVMTGMGSDGQQGAAWIKARGGIIFTEAEESCIVYGMPRSVVEAGLSDRSIPLARLAQSLVEMM